MNRSLGPLPRSYSRLFTVPCQKFPFRQPIALGDQWRYVRYYGHGNRSDSFPDCLSSHPRETIQWTTMDGGSPSMQSVVSLWRGIEECHCSDSSNMVGEPRDNCCFTAVDVGHLLKSLSNECVCPVKMHRIMLPAPPLGGHRLSHHDTIYLGHHWWCQFQKMSIQS